MWIGDQEYIAVNLLKNKDEAAEIYLAKKPKQMEKGLTNELGLLIPIYSPNNYDHLATIQITYSRYLNDQETT